MTWSIPQTASAKFSPARAGASTIPQTASATSTAAGALAGLPAFSLPWSHYVRLLGVANPEARHFYETEALRGGWTVRQLDRQIGSQLYERTALLRNKTAMLRKGQMAMADDLVTPEAGNVVCAWATSGTASTCSSSTEGSGAWSSSI